MKSFNLTDIDFEILTFFVIVAVTITIISVNFLSTVNYIACTQAVRNNCESIIR
jgi:hypothetical protein